MGRASTPGITPLDGPSLSLRVVGDNRDIGSEMHLVEKIPQDRGQRFFDAIVGGMKINSGLYGHVRELSEGSADSSRCGSGLQFRDPCMNPALRSARLNSFSLADPASRDSGSGSMHFNIEPAKSSSAELSGGQGAGSVAFSRHGGPLSRHGGPIDFCACPLTLPVPARRDGRCLELSGRSPGSRTDSANKHSSTPPNFPLPRLPDMSKLRSMPTLPRDSTLNYQRGNSVSSTFSSAANYYALQAGSKPTETPTERIILS